MAEIKWTAPEYEHRPKDVSWFWISIIIAVVLLAAAVWQKNFLFGFFIVVAEMLLLVWGNREPREVGFLLSEKGLTVDGKKFYAWGEIRDWSAEEPGDSGWGDLLLNFNTRLKPDIRVLVPKSRFPEVKNALAEKAPETEREESVVDALQKFLGF